MWRCLDRFAFLPLVLLPACTGVFNPLHAAPPIELSFRDTPVFSGAHEHDVTSLAFSPAGDVLASGSQDGFVRLWAADNGRLLRMFGNDELRGVHGLAWSPDGKTLAVVGNTLGLEVQLWDPATGELIKSFAERADATNSELSYRGRPVTARPNHAVAFSGDGKLLATAGETVTLRDIASGEVLATLVHPTRPIRGLVFAADGKRLATGAEDGKVRWWSVPEGTLLETYASARPPLSCLALAADGSAVLGASSPPNANDPNQAPARGRIWMWQGSDQRPTAIDAPGGPVRQFLVAGPEKLLVGAGRQLLQLNLRPDGPQVRLLDSLSQQILAVAVSPDGKRAAIGGIDRRVHVVDLEGGTRLYQLPGLTDIIGSIATASDGTWFATATIDGRFKNRTAAEDELFMRRFRRLFGDDPRLRPQPSEVRIWSTADGRMLRSLPVPAAQVTAIASIPGGSLLAIAGWSSDEGGILSFWDVESGEQVTSLDLGAKEVQAVAIAPDGKLFASGDAAGMVELRVLDSGNLRRGHKCAHPVEALAFSPDSEQLAFAEASRTIRRIDVGSGMQLAPLECPARIRSLAFSPDGRYLAAGTRVPGLELFDLTAGTQRTLKAEGDYFETMPGYVAFSPDGRLIVCGGKGKNIAVFNVNDGTLHGELKGHYHAPTAAAFLADGRLVSGGEERTIRLWDAGESKLLATWVVVPADREQGWNDEWVAYSPAGEFITSADRDRLVGWRTGGQSIGPEADGLRRRVELLFPKP